MKKTIIINTTFLSRYWHWIIILGFGIVIFLLLQSTSRLEYKNEINEIKSDSLLIELKNKETLQSAIKRQDSISEIQSEIEKKSLELLRKQKNEKTIIYISDDELPRVFSERFNKGK